MELACRSEAAIRFRREFVADMVCSLLDMGYEILVVQDKACVCLVGGLLDSQIVQGKVWVHFVGLQDIQAVQDKAWVHLVDGFQDIQVELHRDGLILVV